MKRLSIFLFAVFAFGCSSPIDDLLEVQDKALDFFDAWIDVGCECFHEEDGFDTPGECKEEHGFSSEHRADFLDCMRDSIESLDTDPPEKMLESTSCFRDVYDEGESCMRAVECSEFGPQVEECWDEVDRAIIICERILDDEAKEWADEMNEKVNDNRCFELLDWIF